MLCCAVCSWFLNGGKEIEGMEGLQDFVVCRI